MLEILTPLNVYSSAAPDDQKQGGGSNVLGDGDDDLESIFAHLELEEPSMTPLGNSPLPASSNSPAASARTYLKLSEGSDSAFKVWCFLQDLGDIRESSKRAWEKYAKGELSYFNASLTTGAAFGLLRRVHEQFAEISPTKSTAWASVLEYLGIQYFVHGQVVWLHPSQSSATSAPQMPKTEARMVELLCPVAFVCLQDLLDVVSEATKNDDIFKRTGKSTETPPTRIVHDFFIALYNALPEIMTISQKGLRRSAADEFLEGLMDITRTKRIETWHVVACQMYLDLYDLIGARAGHGVEALRTIFATIKRRELDMSEHGRPTFGNVSDAAEPRNKLKQLAHKTKAFDDFQMRHLNDTRGVTLTEEGQATVYLEASLPVFSGTVFADLKINMHGISCGIAGYGCSVLSIAHIYKCLQATGALNSDWQDMAFAISAFGKEQPLVAQIGKMYDGEEGWRRYLLALGTSPQVFARGQKAADSKASGIFRGTRAPRQVTVSSPLLQSLLDHSKNTRQRKLGLSKDQLVQAALQGLAAQPEAQRRKTAGPSSTLRGSLTAVQLLDDLQEALSRDEAAINFDYVCFTLSCSRLLEKLFANVVPQDRSPPADNYIALVATFLRFAGTDPQTCYIHERAETLRSHIRDEGKRFIKEAFDESSGRIPKLLRPIIQVDNEGVSAYAKAFRASFEGLDAKFAMSGRSMAVYSPTISPKDAIALLTNQDGQSFALANPSSTGEQSTTLSLKWVQNVLHGEQSTAGCDPRAAQDFAVSLLEAMMKLELGGQAPTSELCAYAKRVFGFELESLEVEDKDGTFHREWMFAMPLSYNGHAGYTSKRLRLLGGIGEYFRPVFEASPMMVTPKAVVGHAHIPRPTLREETFYAKAMVRRFLEPETQEHSVKLMWSGLPMPAQKAYGIGGAAAMLKALEAHVAKGAGERSGARSGNGAGT